MPTFSNSGRVRFGVFEVNLNSGELRKHGIKIKLHDQPFKVLAVLLEHPGEVITREQLYQRLWPAGTFVDSDMGLNSAVMKLRDALGDSAEEPRFVETLPRRGYRLIVDVHVDSASPGEKPESPRSIVSPPGDLAPGVEPFRSVDQLKAQEFPYLKAAIAAVLLIVLAMGSWWLMRPEPGPYKIAVLPLKDLNPEPGTDYFSDGLTDEIIHNLSIIDGLQVKSPTSSFAFKDKPRDIHTVGAQLGASLVLDGSVLQAGDELRVDIQLIRVSDDTLLWSGHYDREMKDVFEIQDEISRSIVNELRLNLGRGQRRYNTNLQAYDLYLKAEALGNSTPGGAHEKIAASIPLFEQAIAKDRDFAPAYVGIADAYASLSATPRTFSPELAYSKMRQACEKALQLDPLLAEAYACMGLIYSRERAWADAEKSFRRAIQLNPNLSTPRQHFAVWVLFPLGKVDEAVSQLHTAIGLDPLSRPVVNSLDFLLMNIGRYNEVLDNCRRVLAGDPNDYAAQQLSGRALVQKGRLTEGIAIFERLGIGSEGWLGYAYAKAGRRPEAERLIEQFPDMPYLQVIIYGGLGDKDRALDQLENMIAIKDPRAGIYLTIPELALLRGDPRLSKLRAELGLPQTG